MLDAIVGAVEILIRAVDLFGMDQKPLAREKAILWQAGIDGPLSLPPPPAPTPGSPPPIKFPTKGGAIIVSSLNIFPLLQDGGPTAPKSGQPGYKPVAVEAHHMLHRLVDHACSFPQPTKRLRLKGMECPGCLIPLTYNLVPANSTAKANFSGASSLPQKSSRMKMDDDGMVARCGPPIAMAVFCCLLGTSAAVRDSVSLNGVWGLTLDGDTQNEQGLTWWSLPHQPATLPSFNRSNDTITVPGISVGKSSAHPLRWPCRQHTDFVAAIAQVLLGSGSRQATGSIPTLALFGTRRALLCLQRGALF